MAREMTVEEVRTRLLKHVWTMIEYWERDDRVPEAREKLSGLAFSILAALDGSAAALPAFAVAPMPHPDDAEFNRARGKDWYPSAGNVPHDIGGGLHEHFHEHDPRKATASAQ